MWYLGISIYENRCFGGKNNRQNSSIVINTQNNEKNVANLYIQYDMMFGVKGVVHLTQNMASDDDFGPPE